MKNNLVMLSPRAALFIGAALLSTPAFAQDTQVTPPPVVSTVPAPAPAPAPTITIAPSAPVVQAIPETPAAETRATSRAAARPAARTTTTTRQVTRTTAPAAPTPEAAAPVAAPAPAPVEAVAPAPEAAAPLTPTETEVATTETTAPAQAPMPIWPWLLVGALIVAGAVIALLMRRRNDYVEEPYQAYEPVTADPAIEPVIVPVAAAEKTKRATKPRHEPEVTRVAPSVAAGVGDTVDNEPDPNFSEPVAEVELAEAEKEDLAGLTSKAPVKKRPWLEFGMRPVRAGTSSDEALVEIELTVGNAGDMPAKDVRISAFMLVDGEMSHMEELLVDRGNDTAVPPVTIKPGEGTRVDATLAIRKDTLSEHAFSPMVVADARYTMADGTEGRTSATFRVGLWGESEKLEPIAFDRPEMHRDVAAELVGKPAHA